MYLNSWVWKGKLDNLIQAQCWGILNLVRIYVQKAKSQFSAFKSHYWTFYMNVRLSCPLIVICFTLSTSGSHWSPDVDRGTICNTRCVLSLFHSRWKHLPSYGGGVIWPVLGSRMGYSILVYYVASLPCVWLNMSTGQLKADTLSIRLCSSARSFPFIFFKLVRLSKYILSSLVAFSPIGNLPVNNPITDIFPLSLMPFTHFLSLSSF